MDDSVVVMVNGAPVRVARGSSVAVALVVAGAAARRSVSGEPRGPVCGMGVCMECRAEVDGVLHSRTCQMACEAGMQVRTQ